MVTDNGSQSTPMCALPLMLVLVVAVVGSLVFMYARTRDKYAGAPRFSGPPVAGTARVVHVNYPWKGKQLPS
jgi:hypothetical protein